MGQPPPKALNASVRLLTLSLCHCICVSTNLDPRLQAHKLNPQLPLPLLGMAQMNLLQNALTNAVSLLESALDASPGWGDAIKACSYSYAESLFWNHSKEHESLGKAILPNLVSESASD